MSQTIKNDELLKAVIKSNVKDSLEIMCEFICQGLEEVESTYPLAGKILDQIEAAAATTKSPVKEFFARIVVDVYSDPVLLKAFIASLPERVQKIYEVLLWEGPQTVGMLEARFGRLILTGKDFEKVRDNWNNSRPENYLQRELRIFHVSTHNNSNYGYYSGRESPDTVAKYQVAIPPELMRLCREYLPPPSAKALPTSDQMPQAQFVFEEQVEFRNLAADIFQYQQEGFLDYTANSKPKKASLRKMREFFEVAEFFPVTDKEWGLQRTEILEFLMGQLPSLAKLDGMSVLRAIVAQLSGTSKRRYNLAPLLFRHIRNSSYYTEMYSEQPRSASSAIVKAFSRLPVGSWVAADDFLRNLVITNAIEFYFSPYAVSRGLEFTATDTSVRQTHSSLYRLHEALITPLVHRPLVFGYAFFFAALGMLDITYDQPTGWLTNGVPYVTEESFASGLRGIRLTNLGAYLLGVSEDYIPVAKKKSTVTVEFDADRLIAVMSADDNMTSAILSKFGEKITERHYRISHAKFLEDCTSVRDVERKVALFEERFGNDIPKNWREFLQSFKNRSDVLVPQDGFIVCTIAGDGELLGLLARDTILKKYVVKVEGRRAAIEKQHWNKVRNRLKELGYFIRV